MGPLAIAACAVLMLFSFSSSLLTAVLILGTSGLFTCYQLAANAAFVSATPTEHRSKAFGLAMGGMSLGQGTMMIVAGAAAERFAPSAAIAMCGAIGTVIAMALAISWHVAARRQGQP
jgi:hypothetical protein